MEFSPFPFFQTFKFWSYFLQIGIFTLSFQTFEFWSYFVNHWNSGPILTKIGILILPVQATNIWRHRNSYIVLLNIWILALCFTHWKFDLILPNIGILRYFYKHCNFYLILPLRSLEFWPYFYRRWNFDVIPPNIAVQAIYTHSNYYLILLNIGIWTLFLYTLEFSSYRLKHWNSRPIFIPFAFLSYPSKCSNFDPNLIHVGFLILSFKTLGFLPYFSKHWNYLNLPNIRILILLFHIGILILSFHFKHQNSALV